MGFSVWLVYSSRPYPQSQLELEKSIKPNRMKFGGMIGYYPGTI